jgi:bifunctional non-homologous end joining protein LigD
VTETLERRVGEHTIEVSRPDKLMFPDDGITKADLVDHYARIAPVMLPHVRGRPITMQRFPDGIGESGFYEKKAPDHFPDWVGRVRVETSDGSQEQIVCENAATLAFLGDQACVTPHIWLATRDHLDAPDQMIFDLDPSVPDVGVVQDAARALHRLLDDLGLASFVKTTGSKGYHVHVPLDGRTDFDSMRSVARDIAGTFVDGDPERLTVEQRKEKRGDRVFVDWLRNAYGQTAVPPYALRSRPGAPVATPLDWSEVGSTAPQAFTIANIHRRLGQRDDPWSGFGRHGQSLDGVADRLSELR